jgi:hypothetical protein
MEKWKPDANARIVIKKSKLKMALLLLGALGLTAIGVYFAINPHMSSYPPAAVMAGGILSAAFFGFCAILYVAKLFNAKPGLVIDDTGITDNTSALAAGHIPWESIVGIKIVDPLKDMKWLKRRVVYAKQELILVIVSNPEYYIGKWKNPIMRKAAEANYSLYGSPVAITTTSLQCRLHMLHDVLQEMHANRKIKQGEVSIK